MKVIGLIGGMSWESTVTYYRIINEKVRELCGCLNSARIILYSVNFHEIEQLQRADAWKEAAAVLSRAARSVESAGADFLVLCTNTMHKVAQDLESSVDIPLLHIADATAAQIKKSGIEKAGLLGTRFTMEQDFYVKRLRDKHNIDVLIPDENDRKEVHRIIYEELCLGKFLQRSKDTYRRIIGQLVDKGAGGIILGCTEIPMIVDQKDYLVPLFDTTAIHACAAVEYALGDYSLFGS